jgi:5-methylcytosine-specific restriction endonuclease McrA
VIVLDSSVLVLNRHYQPVHVTSARRAFTLLYAGAARVIAPDFSTFDFESWAELGVAAGQDAVHTIGRAIAVPRVIVLQVYDRLPKTKVRFSRHNIYARDDNTCQYCKRQLPRTELNLDHVVPRARGGRTTWENVVCCCVPCNLRKGCRLPEEAGMRLMKTPVKPHFGAATRLIGARLGRRPAHREWIPFVGLVDASYWNTELVDDT